MSGFGLTTPTPTRDWEQWLLPPPVVSRHERNNRAVREELCLAGGYGANGTKARALWALCCMAKSKGYEGFVTAGGRLSTQSLMSCRIAQALDFPFEYHCPAGDDTKIIQIIEEAGHTLVRHRPGYTTVCRARGREAAKEKGWYYIDTGVEGPDMPEIVAQAASQVDFSRTNRLLLPAGSGMTLSGILTAISRLPEEKRPKRVIGVEVGSNPRKRIRKWAPWPINYVKFKLVGVKSRFDTPGPSTHWNFLVDPHYSGKVVEFLTQRGDMFWNSGSRHLALKTP